ncbi:hypothetical protein [Sphingomonas zeae]
MKPPEVAQPAIAMLKPDAWTRGVAPAILTMLRSAGFAEEARRDVRFTPSLIAPLLLHPLPLNVAHLTSGFASVHLLRGPGGPHGLYGLKHQIRETFGAPDRVRNLIHGADEGTEHHLQLAAFFPDRPVARHCCLADPDLRFDDDTDLDAAHRCLERLNGESSLGAVIVTLRPDQRRLAGLQRCRFSSLRVSFAALLPVQGNTRGTAVQVHQRRDEDLVALLERVGGSPPPELERLAAEGHQLTLAELVLPAPEVAEYAHALRAHGPDIDHIVSTLPSLRVVEGLARRGINGLHAFHPDTPLMEAELRSDLARLAGLQITGGSAGRVPGGAFSLTARALPPSHRLGPAV